jgi:hypothetical protein
LQAQHQWMEGQLWEAQKKYWQQVTVNNGTQYVIY